MVCVFFVMTITKMLIGNTMTKKQKIDKLMKYMAKTLSRPGKWTFRPVIQADKDIAAHHSEITKKLEKGNKLKCKRFLRFKKA